MAGSKSSEKAKKQETVFVSFVDGEQVSSKAFAHSEAIKAGILDPYAYDLLAPSIAAGFSKGASLICPHCGCSQADFEEKGRFGCPRCYETFSGSVGELLGRLHSGTEHLGKVPRRHASEVMTQRRISKLEASIREAVAREDYEAAARLRDEIESLRIEG